METKNYEKVSKWLQEGIEESSVYLIDVYNTGMIQLKNNLSEYLEKSGMKQG